MISEISELATFNIIYGSLQYIIVAIPSTANSRGHTLPLRRIEGRGLETTAYRDNQLFSPYIYQATTGLPKQHDTT